MIKVEVSLDEKWPVFTLDRPKNEDGHYVIEVDEDFYKQYLYFSLKYHEFQTKIQVLYEQRQREYSELRERCYECFAESAKSTSTAIFNYIPETSKDSLRAFLYESNE